MASNAEVCWSPCFHDPLVDEPRAHLARLEGRTAFREICRCWPGLQVDLDGIRYVHMTNVAGPAKSPRHDRVSSRAPATGPPPLATAATSGPERT